MDDLVDFWHVMEKLAAAAEVIFATMSVAHLLRWKLKLLLWTIACSGSSADLPVSTSSPQEVHS